MRPGSLLAIFVICFLAVCMLFAPILNRDARLAVVAFAFLGVAVVGILEWKQK